MLNLNFLLRLFPVALSYLISLRQDCTGQRYMNTLKCSAMMWSAHWVELSRASGHRPHP